MSAQGGISGFAHGNGTGLRTRAGVAIEAPYGLVKFMEVLQRGILGTDIWFDFLNLGYKIMGEEVSLSAGDQIIVSAQASINSDIDLLDRIELIEQGDVVATVESDSGSEFLELTHEFDAEKGTWLVLRAYGKTAVQAAESPFPSALNSVLPVAGYAAAVTAPIYVSVDGQRTWKRDAVADLAEEMKAELDGVANLTLQAVGGFEEIWQTGEAWTNTWVSQHALLVERIEEVKREYDSLIELVDGQ
jgi:hypothetical protein